MPDDFFEFLVATDTLDDFLGLKEEYKNKNQSEEENEEDEEIEETETTEDDES